MKFKIFLLFAFLSVGCFNVSVYAHGRPMLMPHRSGETHTSSCYYVDNRCKYMFGVMIVMICSVAGDAIALSGDGGGVILALFGKSFCVLKSGVDSQEFCRKDPIPMAIKAMYAINCLAIAGGVIMNSLNVAGIEDISMLYLSLVLSSVYVALSFASTVYWQCFDEDYLAKIKNNSADLGDSEFRALSANEVV